MKKITYVFLVIVMVFCLSSCIVSASSIMKEGYTEQIENHINEVMKAKNIPGVSIVVVDGNETVYQKGFGLSNIEEQKEVTSKTYFELGSTSKAFTGLAILKLEKDGFINLDDSINKYIPWLKMNYKDKEVDLKVSDFLYQTSGIPFKSIGDIPSGTSSDLLELTVKNLVGIELDFKPGSRHQYATLNYDVLGLLIQNVTGISYEEYIKSNILEPLGLNNTYLFRENVPSDEMSKGYRPYFFTKKEYDAPMYRGNKPAGYIITNAEDMAKWLKIQMCTYDEREYDKEIIKKSQTPDRTVLPTDTGASYAVGWYVHQIGSGELSHGGNNPNFSSYIVFRPEDKIGIAVLANTNSSNVEVIGQGVMNIITEREIPNNNDDLYLSLDKISSAIIIITTIIIIAILYMLVSLLIQIIKGKRKFFGNKIKTIIYMLGLLIFIGGFGFCLYKIPDILFWKLPWSFVRVWAPVTFITSMVALFATILIFSLYFVISLVFPKENDKSLFAIATLSIVSGFGNSLIIFMVNEALNREGKFDAGLLMYFIVGIFIYVFGQKLVRTRLINITNNVVYKKRIELLDRVLDSSYDIVENIEYGKIQASMNNDTEVISNFSNIIISGATALVTLLCCFVYMGMINIIALLISIVIIFIAAGCYFFIGRSANKLWNITRDIQNVFFKFINDLVAGFKELNINTKKREDFKIDMQKSCEQYRIKRIKGDLKYANVGVFGELLFTFVVGSVAFLFPLIFTDLDVGSLRTFIFVFLYMTGPVHGVLGAIPEIHRVRISWARINELSEELENYKDNDIKKGLKPINSDSLKIELRGVKYTYKSNDDQTFSVGPINCEFNSGEITYITGGNGSGKSTLAKLVTGLYQPESGEILINGQVINSFNLREQYSTIFSDFYLFEKLYGIDASSKEDEINKYLNILHINDKLKINDGVLSTTKLSTGQRKRLALMISYLEDKEVYLFDEWAADQDPEFRKFFYNSLLPEFKNRNKCVIAITHDDRYFNTADKVLKMEMGKIINKEIH